MPGIVTIEANEMNEFENPSTSSKDILNQIISPRKSMIPQILAPNSEYARDKRPSRQSPSSRSFGSESDGSIIYSEFRKVETVKDEMEKETEGDSSREASSHLATSRSLSSKSRTMGKTPSTKPPIEKKNDNNPLRKQNAGVTSNVTKSKSSSSMGKSRSQSRVENSNESTLCNPELGSFLLKQARDLISLGENPPKALELSLQALKLFEKSANGKPSLDLVMCLHVTAAIYCSLGHYNEAIPIIKRSIEIPIIEEGQQHAMAKFAGHMQLGDTYAMLGQLENSIMCYNRGLDVQRQVLGATDSRVGETCRYVAEANFQAMQFDEAERLCQIALDIHRANGSPSSLEEAADRRLMGLICETNGNHEAALEHLVLASMSMVSNGQEVEVASVDCSIGDTFLSLARYDEAILAYKKALAVFKTHKGENHPVVGSVYVRLAELYSRTWKIRESKSYCESALKIYENPMTGVPPDEIASGFVNVAAIYESMNELEQALKLLHKALEIHNDAPGQQNTIAGIEAQMGVIYYVLGNQNESYNAFKNAVSKLRATGERKSAFFGIVLNQMGLCCVQLCALNEAANLFEEGKVVLEQEYGPYHPETLGVYSNLAGTYDALGRYLFLICDCLFLLLLYTLLVTRSNNQVVPLMLKRRVMFFI